jgi:outer membrane lipoprotein-sorting protein
MRAIAHRSLLALCVLTAAVAASAQTADEVIEKSLAALGGRPALGKLTSRSTTGTMTVSTPGGDIVGTIEVLSQVPNKTRTLLNLDLTPVGGQSLVVDNRFDGTSGYAMDTMRGNSDMPASQVANLRNATFPTPLLDYKERGSKVELAGKEKLADRDVYALTITPTSGPVIHLLIDAQSYLPAKTTVTLDMPELGSVEQSIEFSDYRDVDGVKVPFRLKGSSAVQTFTVVITKVEHNVKIDPALFVKPAAK